MTNVRTFVGENLYTLLIFLAIVSLSAWLVIYNFELANSSGTVTVSATVASSVTCSTDGTNAALGTLTTGSVVSSTPNTVSSTISCNTGGGCSLTLTDTGGNLAGSGNAPGLATTSPAYVIPSPNAALNATATLVAGTEGYGIIATTTAHGADATLLINLRYKMSTDTTLTVGGLSTTSITLASSSGLTTNRQVLIMTKAAISTLTNAASYRDTINLDCTAN